MKEALACSKFILCLCDLYDCDCYEHHLHWKIFVSFVLDGRRQDVHFDKITFRISKLCYNLNMDFVDPVSWRIFYF